MPTLLRFRGFLIDVWLNDDPPAHVHARKGRDFAVFNLNLNGEFVELRESAGLGVGDIAVLRRFIEENRNILNSVWRELHGDW